MRVGQGRAAGKGSSWTNSIAVRALSGIALCCLVSFVSASALFAEEEAKITILAVNPSENKPLKSPVVYYLPTEVKPNDVVDAAGMEVKFDKDKQTYYLSKEVELSPKETKKLTVMVKNVWQVSAEELGNIREELSKRMQALTGTKYEQTSQMLQQRVSEKIDAIENGQKQARERGVGLKKQIDLYRANVKQLEQIRNEIVSLDSMRKMEQEAKGDLPTVKFQISAENPANETKDMTVQANLPSEITADDVINKLDFDLIYDEANKRFGLTKVDTFSPKENKKYIITIRNIWHIPKSELDHLKEVMDHLDTVFKGSAFESYAKQVGAIIYQNLADITELQATVADSTVIEDHQRAYALNGQRLKLTRKKVQELQDLLVDIETSKERNPVKDTLEQWMSKLAMLKDLLLRKLGYKPDRPTTWMIIFGICAFLAALSVGFYLTWIKQVEKERKLQKREE